MCVCQAQHINQALGTTVWQSQVLQRAPRNLGGRKDAECELCLGTLLGKNHGFCFWNPKLLGHVLCGGNPPQKLFVNTGNSERMIMVVVQQEKNLL